MAEPRSEPSMEDILASIKRIISDDPPPQKAAAERPTAAPPSGVERRAPPRIQQVVPPQGAEQGPPPWPERHEPPAPSVLELTDRLPESYRPEPAASDAEGDPHPVQRAVERLRQAGADSPGVARPVPRDLLPRTPTPRSTGSDVTLDALVREMLQPMLTDWIERNLPDIVERMVQSEIRRMTDKND